jgi:hypothetical protein
MSKQPPKKTGCENTLTQLWPVQEVPLVTPKKVYVIKQSEASKKRKAQKQDDLKNRAVAKRSKGADMDKYEDPGPGDYVVHQTAGGGSIPMIVPTSILGCDKGLCLEEDPSIWYIYKDAPGKKTLIRLTTSGTTLCIPSTSVLYTQNYVEKWWNGKIQSWRLLACWIKHISICGQH